MKKRIQFITKIFFLGYLCANFATLQAQTYYVSPSGNDNNDGTSPSKAWASIERVNKAIQATETLKPGSSVFFERGGTYYGSMKLTRVEGNKAYPTNGTKENPIVFGAYGSGAAPVLSGARKITGWQSLGGSRWVAQVTDEPANIDVLFVNGKKYYPARYPNKGYLTVTDPYDKGLKDATLNTADGYWDGATLAFKISNWMIYRDTVAHSYADGRINVVTATKKMPDKAGWGYFFQNHLNALDTHGEWVYNKKTHTLTLLTNDDPNTQQIQYGCDANAFDVTFPWRAPDRYNPYHIVIQDLAFEHYWNAAIASNYSRYLTVQRNFFRNGGTAVKIDFFEYCDVLENTIEDMESFGVYCANVSYSHIHDNNIRRIGTSWDGGQSEFFACSGIRIGTRDGQNFNNYNEITLNRIDSTGYSGMNATLSKNLLIKNNVVNHTLLCFADGGGIYIDRFTEDFTQQEGNRIIDNIVLNTISNLEGSPSGSFSDSHIGWQWGIYLDNGACNLVVEGNTVANAGRGISMYGGNRVHNNVLFNNMVANITGGDSQHDVNPFIFAKNDIQYNYMYGQNTKNPEHSWPAMKIANMAYYIYILKSIEDFKTHSSNNNIDNNYISHPFTEKQFMVLQGAFKSRNDWTGLGYDVHSRSEPISYQESGAATPEEYAILAYNPNRTAIDYPLNGKYMAFDSTVYNGSIHLEPFKSAILFKAVNAKMPVPVSNISLNQSAYSININQTFQLTATISPADADNKNMTWTTSNPAVATVDNTGKVTGVAAGNAIITVTTADGNKKATCNITVIPGTIAIVSIQLTPTSKEMYVGDNTQLTVTYNPANVTNKNVTWSSSDVSIVSVDQTGTVTAIAVGDATITAKTADGGKTATCRINVKKDDDTGNDQISVLSQLLVSPNPSSGAFTIGFEIHQLETMQIDLYSGSGILIDQLLPRQLLDAGKHLFAYNLNINPGIYIVVVKGDHINKRQKLIIK